MMKTKRFPLRILLSITTGRLLTASKGPRDNGISDLYEFLEWLTGEAPFTHQLPRFAEECQPWLLRWFPELKDEETWVQVALADVPNGGIEQAIERYLDAAVSRGCKPEYDVPRIPRDDHTRRDAVNELREKIGSDKVIVIKPCT